jgi:HSP20 family protein
MPSPFEGVSDFFSEMARMREIGRTGYDQAHQSSMRTHATAWVPATDIFARGDDLVIRVELAGVHPEDVDITYSQGTLTVAGRRHRELGGADEDSFFVRERPYGAFRRSITLPATTSESDISAEFIDGLAEITVAGGCSAKAAEEGRIELRYERKEPSRRTLGGG